MNLDPVKIVQLIRDRKPLYDHNLPEFRNKKLTDQLWEEVAQEMNDKVTPCKIKWNSLRRFYRRILRKTNFGLIPRKRHDWYMMPNMAFYFDIAYQKEQEAQKEHKTRMGAKMENLKGENSHVEEGMDTTEVPVGYTGPFTDHQYSNMHRPVYRTRSQPSTSHVGQTTGVSATQPLFTISRPFTLTKKVKQKPKSEAEVANVKFFNSLVPDVNKLSAKKQRELKEIVLCSLYRLLDEQGC